MIFRTYVEENIDQLEDIKEEDISKRNFMKEETSNPNPPPPAPVPVSSAVAGQLLSKETK
jgi:hypothetical protein